MYIRRLSKISHLHQTKSQRGQNTQKENRPRHEKATTWDSEWFPSKQNKKDACKDSVAMRRNRPREDEIKNLSYYPESNASRSAFTHSRVSAYQTQVRSRPVKHAIDCHQVLERTPPIFLVQSSSLLGQMEQHFSEKKIQLAN